jgi:Effector protein
MAKNLIGFIDFELSESKDFVDSVTKEIWTINYWETGKKLAVALTLANAGKVRIRQFSQCAFKNDGTLWYDSAFLQGRPYFEPTQPTVVSSHKTYVYLFHELVHFLHSEQQGIFNYKSNIAEEFTAVGLYNSKFEVISENALRREAGLPRRPCYTWETKSVLYEQERLMRVQLKMPEQNTVGPSSPECKF